jgi:hypothetical protein
MALETVGDSGILKEKCSLEGARLIDPSPIIRNVGHSPIETSLWTPSRKIESNVLPNFSVCGTWECNFVWDKIEVLLGTNCKIGEPFGNRVGTSCEYDGNTLGTREKKSLDSPLPPQNTKAECILSLVIGFVQL